MFKRNVTECSPFIKGVAIFSDLKAKHISIESALLPKKVLPFLLVILLVFSGIANNVYAQYSYAVEGFESSNWPTSDPGSTPVSIIATTGTWKVAKANRQTTTVYAGTNSLNVTSTSFSLTTPALTTGAGIVSFWAFTSSNRTIIVKSSTDGGVTFPTTVGNPTISKTAWTQYSFTINNPAITNIQFTVTGGSGVFLDDFLITTGVTGTPPTVSTISTASAITKYTATLSGNLAAGTQAITSSGICWGVNANPTTALATITTNGPLVSGTITANVSGLNAATVYYFRAYAITAGGTYYGTNETFTTAPAIAPIITTNAIANILSTKATSGGTIIDSGGALITAKGICWAVGATPTISNSFTVDGNSATSPYTSLMTNLMPLTNYCVRAYATNAQGTSYGNQVCFTTKDSTASIFATPTLIDFGTVVYKSTPAVKSYILYGRRLMPSNDSITVTAPAGFLVSLSANSGFATSLKVPYKNGILGNTTIYVQMTTAVYGIYNAVITHTGGSALVDDIQNVTVTGKVLVSPDNASNTGIDFWTGFGYVGQMASNQASMSVYISATEQDATVTVDLPALANASLYGFPKTITVPAGTVIEVSGFPTSTTNPLADAKLYYTGVSGRAVRVTSDNGAPISVWTYTSQPDNSASGCLNFPTNTWNSAYTVQAIGGYTNNGNKPNSFFFVVAKDDNTVVTITPSADIVDSSANTIYKDNTTAFVKYPAGVPFTVTLNKGQVFNAMGVIQGTGTGLTAGKSFALDLSGTKVTTTCDKRIAVFGGNGRCLIDTSTDGTVDYPSASGSDNMLQQMFPTVAWGKEYLTVPTKTMEFNYFRIYISDPTTVVKVNGNTLPTSQLFNNLYYQISGNQPFKIEGSKPISVSQFIVAGTYSSNVSSTAFTYGNNGKGDPEMIILSPIQQSISKATVYTPFFKNGGAGGNYINVIVKKEGVKSFRIYSDTIKANRVDTALYSLGLFDVNSPLKYKMLADTSNLMLVDTGASSYISGAAYLSADSLLWVDKAFKVYPADTNYYYAKLKVQPGNQYTLSSSSTFSAIAYGMNQGESYGFNAGTNINNLTTVASISVQNPYGPLQKSTNAAGINTCLGIPFNFSTAITFRADSLRWNFGANPNMIPNAPVLQTNPVPDSVRKVGTDSLYYYTLKSNTNQPLPYKFTALGTYPVTLVAFSSNLLSLGTDPCTAASDSIKFAPFNVNVIAGVIPNFTTNYANCQTDSLIKFTDLSTDASNRTIVGWRWDFGYNSKVDSVKNPQLIYRNSGTYNVKLRAINDLGCYYDTTKALTLKYNSIPKFVSSVDTACAKATIVFTDSSKTVEPGGTITQWNWNFGDASTANIAKPSKAYSVAGQYTVSLQVVNNAGCTSPTVTKKIVINPNPRTDFVKSDSTCTASQIQFTAAPIPNATNITGYLWSFGDASSATIANPLKGYTSAGTYNVKLEVTDKNGCKGDTTKTVVALSALAAPVVTMDSVSYNYMRFKWNPVVGAISYQVSLDGGTTFTAPSSGATGLTHVILGVQPSLIQNIIVKAFGLLPCQSSLGNGTGNYPNPGVFIPNAFTPNGDGKNDIFKVYGNYIKAIDMKIFNQWGELIYQTNNVNGGWDGSSKGQQQPIGVYVYLIQTIEQNGAVTSQRGSINLVR
jgi:gliding motility-associated-like protein